ncbi:SDR family oxidoreductase [Amycolatopsis jiangsuensis]|uniref:3-oxoacyl-[acyl-carrier protein] reductase n=1 Tax=Amycolatopsis jiangsuensis TaxID=1181879 RepID=A0A840J2X7_9PSEU|nr:SDR family oxidoreductase [Amycolatopsis jiangsuensis]MBB4688410.1 3-oxoacyl-[acyl-carrier protein] reductase [Amycolatopsis jiangsuensis]
MAGALVTGGSRGIGRAIAQRLGAAGLPVGVNYRTDEAAARAVVGEIIAGGGAAVALRGDVTDDAELRGLFDAAEREFDGLDVVVANVGVARFAPLADTTDEDFDLVFSTNLRSAFATLREAARRVRDGGRIVVISSGVVVTARAGTGIYGASKAAGDHFVRALAKELGPRGITVNSVLPGAVRTEALVADGPAGVIEYSARQTPLGRIGEPDDIAGIVGFLVSDAARWVTGQTLHAGGGQF